MFGTRSAPFLAIRVMHQLAANEGQSFPLAVYVVKQQMYIDDILSGADNLHSGTFELRKWASNDPRLLKNIPLEHLETKGTLDLQTSDGIRALGVCWTPLEDSFRFRVNFEIPVCIPTKRIILSTIARLFDPMGWLSPIVITAKMLMQVLWKTKLKWDDHVPTDVQKSWESRSCLTSLPYKYPDTLQGASQTTLDNYISSAMRLLAHMALRRIYAYAYHQRGRMFRLRQAVQPK
ncbi:hypothetical protein ACLKA6_000604 [Drosophila palustris]